jgi:hypothetical protein
VSDPVPAPVAEPSADLEYDLAHEPGRGTPSVEATSVEGRPDDAAAPEQRQTVATSTPDYDGDYSYDLAHDIPAR